jgi:hypothetical protein
MFGAPTKSIRPQCWRVGCRRKGGNDDGVLSRYMMIQRK